MCPTLLNFQSDFCHCAISAASAAASPGRAVRQRARTPSRSSDESRADKTCQSAERYFGESPRSRATASGDFVPVCQGGSFLERGGEVFLERQPAAFVRGEDDALEIHRVAAAGVGESAVERADLGEDFLGPVASSRARRKPYPVREQHGVARDGLPGVEILCDE